MSLRSNWGFACISQSLTSVVGKLIYGDSKYITNGRRREKPKLTPYDTPKASPFLIFMFGKDKNQCITYFSVRQIHRTVQARSVSDCTVIFA